MLLHKNIRRVDIKKMSGGSYQFQNVELSIGNMDMSGSALAQFTSNIVAGNFYGASNTRDYTYEVFPTLSGQYLTLQCSATIYFAVDEIWVFQEL